MRVNRVALFGLVFSGGLAAWGQETGPNLKQIAQTFAETQIEKSFRLMNRPFEPFRVIGNIYYVGATDVSSFRITTPEGHILIDSEFEATVPLIRDVVRKLGFRFEDIKILTRSEEGFRRQLQREQPGTSPPG